MKFGNPVSSVTISGGTVAITAAGTLSTTGVVTSSPSTSVPASNVANVAGQVANGASTVTLLAGIAGQQILIASLIVSLGVLPAAGNSQTCSMSLQDSSSNVLAVFTAATGSNFAASNALPVAYPAVPFDLSQYQLPAGIGLKLVFANSGALGAFGYSVTLAYATVAAGGSFTGHTIHV